MSKQHELAIDFAVLATIASKEKLLPAVEDCHPDTSDFERGFADPDWVNAFHERKQDLVRKEIESHQFSKYLLAKGYSWEDIYDFVLLVKGRQLSEMLDHLGFFSEETK